MKLLTIILCGCILFASCSASKKAHQYVASHPEEFAKECADAYPVKEVLLPGDTVTITDTLYGAGQSDTVIIKGERDTVRITKTLPPKIITNTRTIHDTLVKENTARVSELANALNDALNREKALQEKYAELKAKWKGKVGIPWWILLIIGLAGAGWAYWRIKAGALNSVISKLNNMKSIILFFLTCLCLTSCATFHDEPTKSVWSEGAWIAPWATGIGAAIFLVLAFISSNSGSTYTDGKGNVYPSKENVPVYKLGKFWFGVALAVATIVIIYNVVSNR